MTDRAWLGTWDLQLAEWDWMYGEPRYDTLHHVIPPDEPYRDWATTPNNLQTSCGRVLKWAQIPGIFARIATKRCDKCCDAIGYPRGIGSPKNDEGCKPLLAERLARIAG